MTARTVDRHDTGQAWTWSELDRVFTDAPPFARLLPWRWVEEDRIHVLADGSLGLAWRLPLLDAELSNEEARAPMATALEGLLNRLPPGAAFQALLFSRPGLGGPLARWRALAPDTPNPFQEQVVAARDRTLSQGAQGFFAEYRARQATALLTVRLWPAEPRIRGWQRALGALRSHAWLKTAGRAWHETADSLRRVADMVEAQAKLLDLPLEPLGGQAFLALVWQMLNPASDGPPPRWDPTRALNTQAVQGYVMLRRDGIGLDGLEGRVLSVLALPRETWPGMLTLAQGAVGSGGCLGLPGTFLVTVAGAVLDQERVMGHLHFKKAVAWQQRTTIWGDQAVEASQMREELDQLLRTAFAAGTRVCQAAFHLVSFDAPDRISRTMEAALGALGQMDLRVAGERLLAGPTWLESLPFGYDPALERWSRRGRRVLADNLADLLPLYGGFPGTRTPAQLFLNRRGEAVGFDPFDADTAPHCLITGVTGSGKSFQTTDLILQQLRLGADVFVLDKGDSYRRLAELVGGQYLAISPNAPLTINPCAGDGSKEHQAFLTLVLAEMASGGDARFPLDREQIGVLAEAVAETFRRAPTGGEVCLGDVARTLTQDPDADRLGPRIARRLFPFLAAGPYGTFFDGPNQFVAGGGLTVVELKELASYPDLQAVMTLVLLHQVTGFVSQRPRGQRKLFVVDEAWSLLRSDNAAKVLETAARTYRKYGCAAVFISQYLTDFEGPSGRAVRENCPNRLFLRQEPEALGRLKELIGLTEYQAALLRTAGSVRGAFSEGLLVTPSGSGLVRLIVDPLTYWTATTAPQDQARWAVELARSGGDARRAVARIVGEHGETAGEPKEPLAYVSI